MTNLFDADSHPEGILLHISAELHASQDVQQSEVETGENKFGAFVEETEGKTNFYALITRSSLKTFSVVKKGKASDLKSSFTIKDQRGSVDEECTHTACHICSNFPIP